MFARPWIAIMLFINYLLVVGAGCINRPEDQHELLLVRTSVDGQTYQQCRYLRMDGLEAFLNEALTSRYQDAPDTTPHHVLSVVGGVDAHCFAYTTYLLPSPVFQTKVVLAVSYLSPMPGGVHRSVYTPPWPI